MLRRSILTAFAVMLCALPTMAHAQDDEEPARQVTVFAVIASPDDLKVDPKLKKVLPQLRKLMPNHGFRLLDVKSKRLTSGQAIACDLGDGYKSNTTLIDPSDADGKVKLRCSVTLNDVPLLESKVTTPANQLFFCDKALDDGTRLLVGIGAR